MLMRFDPFRDFDRIGAGRAPFMPMDAYRHDDSVEVDFDLPGVDPSSIDVTVERNALTVKAERHWDRGDGADVLAAERPQGAFTRQLFLGDGLATDRLEAHYHDGVLSLSIPVAETARPRKVEIATGETAKAIETANA